jgi:hypothetical protein
VTALGQLASDARIPSLAVGKRSRVLAWGTNIAAPWSAVNVTIRPEDGPMRCLFASYVSANNGGGYSWASVEVDGVSRCYHRVYVNAVGHRPMVPAICVVDLNPGVHQFWVGRVVANLTFDVGSTFWSYFVLATSRYDASTEPTRSPDRATLGQMSNGDVPRLSHTTDVVKRAVYSTGNVAAVGHLPPVGPWNHWGRHAELTIFNDVARPALVCMYLTAFNLAVNTVPTLYADLQDDGGAAWGGVNTRMGFNDGPCHRSFVPYVQYGTLPVGTWMPRIANGAGCNSDATDTMTGFALLGV